MEDLQIIQEGMSGLYLALLVVPSEGWSKLPGLLVCHHQMREHGSYHSGCCWTHLQLYQTPTETRQYGSLACIRVPKGTCGSLTVISVRDNYRY